MTGYQQAILYLNGSQMLDRFAVRNIDRHYIDAVSDLFPRNMMYLQRHRGDGRKDYWAIKSSQVQKPLLSEVRDFAGFCRGFVEMQGTLDRMRNKCRGHERFSARLRIYGAEADLQFVMGWLPARPKKIQHIRTQTGSTCGLYYQSHAEVVDILDAINGSPRNEAIWQRWAEIVPIK